MSVSRHPIALRLERQVGGATRLLGTVMALPLIDGIFPALIIAGALSTPSEILQTGLLIFGGSATVAVILAEMDGSRREQLTSVALIGAVILPVAAVEAAFAQTIQTLLNFEVFHRFAGVVILAVAAKTASSEVGEKLPSPGVIIGLGLVASFDPAGAQVVLDPDPTTILHAVAAAGTGVAFAFSVALFGPHLRGVVDIDRFRFGSSVALGMLALDILGVLPTERPIALGVLGVTALFAYDPGGVVPGTEDDATDSDPDAVSVDADERRDPAHAQEETSADPGSDAGYEFPDEGDSRAPWL